MYYEYVVETSLVTIGLSGVFFALMSGIAAKYISDIIFELSLAVILIISKISKTLDNCTYTDMTNEKHNCYLID